MLSLLRTFKIQIAIVIISMFMGCRGNNGKPCITVEKGSIKIDSTAKGDIRINLDATLTNNANRSYTFYHFGNDIGEHISYLFLHDNALEQFQCTGILFKLYDEKGKKYSQRLNLNEPNIRFDVEEIFKSKNIDSLNKSISSVFMKPYIDGKCALAPGESKTKRITIKLDRDCVPKGKCFVYLYYIQTKKDDSFQKNNSFNDWIEPGKDFFEGWIKSQKVEIYLGS